VRRGALVAAIIVVLAALAYGGHRLWLKSDDLLAPVVITAHADAAALVHPSLATRVAALAGRTRAPLAARERLIALTFDDGPYPIETPLLVQTLHDLGVPATFFLIGRDAQQFPALTRLIAANGGEIADHTLTHPDLDRLGVAEVQREISSGAAALTAIAPDPAVRTEFRPPHGRYTLDTVRAAQDLRYATILWNDDPGDWRAVTPAMLEQHILRRATAPEILLLHNGRQATVAMLPAIVTRYRGAGYTFVTVGELLRRVPIAHLNRPARVSLVR
jgi:peptidoglycan/xylan/chitin deacetylase (PgdA/CDA1 family)